MGTKNVGKSDSNIKQSESESTTKTGTGSGNTDSNSTGTGTGTGSISSRPSGTGTGTGTGTGKRIKTEKNSKVSVLEPLPEVNIPVPQEEKKTKRKYTKKAKTEEASAFNAEQISAFIVTVSSVVATREGCSHWLISEAEAMQISKPLANILEKSQLKVINENADAIALVTACLMIIAPRIILTLQNNKNKKGVKKANGQHNNVRKSSDSNGKVSSENARKPSSDSSTIFESIAPIQ